MRTLEELANATPKDYLRHIPKSPEAVAMKMLATAGALSPLHVPESQGDNVLTVETRHRVLYMGPGSGLIVQPVLDQGHLAHGHETSRRGVASAPENVRNYVVWGMPWETSFPNKYFHVAVVSSFLKEILTPAEWKATNRELKRISNYQAIYAT